MNIHTYQLPSFDGEEPQTLQFIEKKTNDAGEFVTVKDGTTNEEVLKVLIHRLKGLNEIMACRENSIAITKLEEALMWLEKRTADRKERDVEGTPEK